MLKHMILIFWHKMILTQSNSAVTTNNHVYNEFTTIINKLESIILSRIITKSRLLQTHEDGPVMIFVTEFDCIIIKVYRRPSLFAGLVYAVLTIWIFFLDYNRGFLVLIVKKSQIFVDFSIEYSNFLLNVISEIFLY